MGYPKIVWEKKSHPPTKEKKEIEVLKERLNQKIQSSPELAKKAAHIIEQWLKKSKP